MHRIFGICLTAVIVVSLLAGGCATDQKKPTVERSRLVTVTATVEALDLNNRLVTLKGPKGNVVTFRVDEIVKNLPQVKVGDKLAITYTEALAISVERAEK